MPKAQEGLCPERRWPDSEEESIKGVPFWANIYAEELQVILWKVILEMDHEKLSWWGSSSNFQV